MGFAVVAEWLGRSGRALSHVERSVLLALATYADKHGKAYPAIPTLAEDSGAARSAVFEALESLERKGVLRSERKAGSRTTWWIAKSLPEGLTRPPRGPVRNTDPSATRTVPVRNTDSTRPPGGPKESQEETQEETQLSATADAPPSAPQELALDLTDQPPLKQWEKANAFCKVWNATMHPVNPKAVPNPKTNRLFAAAFDRFGDKLEPMLQWCAKDWKWSGANGSARTAQAFFSRDVIETVLADKRNTDAGTRKNPNERKPNGYDPVAAEDDRRRRIYAGIDVE